MLILFFDMYAYELFLLERGLTEDDMEVYFEENPDEMDYLVKKSPYAYFLCLL